MDPRHENGVTLVELLVTIAALVILASLAVPSFNTVLQNNGLTASVNTLITDITLARAEALKRNAPVTICRTNNANADSPSCGAGDRWDEGWVVFIDEDGDANIDGGEEVLAREGGLPARGVQVTVLAADAPLDDALTYLPSGFPDFNNAVDGGRDLLFCDQRASDEFARVLNVSQTGRTQVRARSELGADALTCEPAEEE
ncbi:MAG: GspH/FimT family pseudopilin [Pseudomonadota bacterium]